MFALKCTTFYTVYCINSGLLDAPCNNFQFFFFSQICLVQKQTMSNVFNKKICGALPSCKPWYCSIWHLEARQYFWLCGSKAFSETLRWVIFLWTDPCLIIVVEDWVMHATVEFRWLWLHIRKDVQVCDASAGVSLEEIQQSILVVLSLVPRQGFFLDFAWLPYTFLTRVMNCLFVSPYIKMLRHYLIGIGFVRTKRNQIFFE